MSETLPFTVMNTNQTHNEADGPLDIDTVVAVDCDQAGLATDRRELDESRIVRHDAPQLFSPICDHPVELARKNGGVSGHDILCL